MSDQLPPPLSPPSTPASDDAGRAGPVWEHPGPVVPRFLETVRGVLLDTVVFFRTMRRRGGLASPLTFGVAGTLLGALIGALYQFMFASMSGGLGDVGSARDAAIVGLLSSGCIVVFLPLIAVVAMFVSAAIYHVMLLLLGAARQPFETTMRVVAYSMGSTSVLQIVPVCGGVFAAVWAIVANIIGLARTHEISTGRAAAAVLLPVLACCVIIALFYAALIAVLVGAAVGGRPQ
jgi:hypothetical protein